MLLGAAELVSSAGAAARLSASSGKGKCFWRRQPMSARPNAGRSLGKIALGNLRQPNPPVESADVGKLAQYHRTRWPLLGPRGGRWRCFWALLAEFRPSLALQCQRRSFPNEEPSPYWAAFLQGTHPNLDMQTSVFRLCRILMPSYVAVPVLPKHCVQL
jgi:hypothetical protein